MATLSWVGAEDALTSQALTVRAQTLPADNAGELIWDAFMPRIPVRSTKIRNILTQQEIRYTADRREFNARGRLIPFDTVGTEMIKITPIESYFKLEEEEMQELEEMTTENEALFREIIRASIPERVDSLVRANWRRVEMDVFRSWTTGQITVRNPQLGHLAQTFSYGIAAGHYLTAATQWTDVSLNAYDELLKWIDAGEKVVGLMQGAAMRRATYNELLKDASAALSMAGFPMIRLTQRQFEDRISEERGRPFQFFLIDNTIKEFADGGTDNLTETNLWPAATIAAVPSQGAPGFVADAPVGRAYELARIAPEAKISRNGMSVYCEVAGNGRELTCEAQGNLMPILNEEKIYVTSNIHA